MNADSIAKTSRLDAGIAAALFCAVLALLLATANDPGMAWDEGNDIRMARGAAEWITGAGGAARFSRGTIEKYWEYEWKQHPAVSRIYFAAVYLARGGDLNSSGEGQAWKAYRLGPMLLFSLLVAGVYLFGAARLGGRSAGFAAAAALAFMPRMFGHAHIVETDLVLCALWFAAGAAFLRGLESRRWAALSGVLLGLLAAVKFTGLFAAAPFFAYALVFERKKVAPNALAAIVLAPAAFYISQPMYWHAPVQSFGEYVRHFLAPAARGTISTMYFGVKYANSPPWSYPWVITALSIPVAALSLAAVGAVVGIKRGFARTPVIFFILANALFLPALFSPPRVAIYDGERLLLPAFPFIALLAGAGFSAVFGRLARHWRAFALACFAALVFVPVWQSRPYNLCYYNEIIGGPAGAARRGMDVMYWGEVFTPEFAERINTRLPRGARITTIGYYSGNLEYFKNMGLLRGDFEIVNYGGEADFLIAVNRPGVLDLYTAYLFRNTPPIISTEWKGIRLAGVYLLKPGLRFLRGKE